MASRREPVSVVCVFSDAEVRRRCLDRSIEDHRREAEVEYLPIDNTDGSFPTAGAALNHGAALARNDYIVFVHQDVYLHSLRRLEYAAGMLADDPGIGVLGAAGITAGGECVGRIRDRVILLGRPASRPSEVDSLDELLFMVPRSLIAREPLSEAPELAWHAYAVEYGLRARSLGLRVCTLDLPLTHNSLTTNLDRLDVAYAAVAAHHPRALPVRSNLRMDRRAGTCGGGALAAHRWRYRWLRESLAAMPADGRWVAERACWATSGSTSTTCSAKPGLAAAGRQPRTRSARSPTSGRPTRAPASRPADHADRVEPLRRDRQRSPRGRPAPRCCSPTFAEPTCGRSPRGSARSPACSGFRSEIGFWMLLGAAATAVPPQWRSPKARPTGMRKFAEQPSVV